MVFVRKGFAISKYHGKVIGFSIPCLFGVKFELVFTDIYGTKMIFVSQNKGVKCEKLNKGVVLLFLFRNARESRSG